MILRIPIREGYENILAGPEASVRVVVRTEIVFQKVSARLQDREQST